MVQKHREPGALDGDARGAWWRTLRVHLLGTDATLPARAARSVTYGTRKAARWSLATEARVLAIAYHLCHAEARRCRLGEGRISPVAEAQRGQSRWRCGKLISLYNKSNFTRNEVALSRSSIQGIINRNANELDERYASN